MLIPAVSVLAAITLLPALLSLLGPRINRLRVMPKRFDRAADRRGRASGTAGPASSCAGPRPSPPSGSHSSRCCSSRPSQLNPSEAQAKDLPGDGDAFDGRAALVDAGISLGVLKPFVVLAEGDPTPAQLDRVAARLAAVEGVSGAAAPPAWRREGAALIEAFPASDGASREARGTIATIKTTFCHPWSSRTEARCS